MEHRRQLWESDNPGKRATERFWLAYTVIWGGVSGVVMLSGLAERWGDLELMIFGVLLGAGALLGPLVFRAPADRGRPLRELAGFKLGLSVVGFAFFMNYSQTPFFWDALHMHYGFNSTINIQNNPVFLYFVTIAYFATYCALLNGAFRLVSRRLAGRPRAMRFAGILAVPFVIAGLETAMNANPFMKSLFCYDDMVLMMTFGTFCYGTSFVCTLPVWIAIDEEATRPTRLRDVVLWVCAAMYAIVLAFDFHRHVLAPHFTTVETGAVGLRDFESSCLVPPAGHAGSATEAHEAERPVIVVSADMVRALGSDHERMTGRSVSPTERAGLIRQHVTREVLYREALALGLDEQDLIVRRRLVQKMESLLDAVVTVEEPSAEDLEAHHRAHPERYREPERIGFRHVYVADRDASSEAAEILVALRSGAAPETQGDAFIRGRAFVAQPVESFQGIFGSAFAEALPTLPEGRWSGPVPSSYGLHLVHIDARVPKRDPPIEELTARLTAELLELRRTQAHRDALEEMRERYDVRVHQPG